MKLRHNKSKSQFHIILFHLCRNNAKPIQSPSSNCDGWSPCQGEDLHCKETHQISQLDWSHYQRLVTESKMIGPFWSNRNTNLWNLCKLNLKLLECYIVFIIMLCTKIDPGRIIPPAVQVQSKNILNLSYQVCLYSKPKIALQLNSKNTIEDFHVTSYQVNFASHHTCNRYVGFLSA